MTASENMLEGMKPFAAVCRWNPRETVQFAKLVGHGSSRSVPKSRYDVLEAAQYLLVQDETGRHARPAVEGKVDGLLLENRQF